MKNVIPRPDRICSLIIYLVFSVFVLNAQVARSQVEIPTGTDAITDVFVLNSCAPTGASFKIESYYDKGIKYFRVKRIAIRKNHLSAFKVININPLKYACYVTGQSMNQFVNDSSVNATVLIDTGSSLINDIKAIQLFGINTAENKNSAQNRQKTITDLQADVDKYFDSIDHFQYASDDLFAEASDLGLILQPSVRKYMQRGSSIPKPVLDKINSKSKSIDSMYRIQYQKGVKALDEYRQAVTVSWPKTESILSGLLKTYDQNLNASLLNKTSSQIKDCIAGLQEADNGDKESFEAIRRDRLSIIQPSKDTLVLIKEELDGLNALYNQRIRNWASFINFAMLETGKLLQDQLIQCSRFQNKLQAMDCITDIDILEINQQVENDRIVFQFIQSTTEDISDLINCLQLEDPSFDSVASVINSNYKQLLNYWKVLDFVKNDSRVVYTRPLYAGLQNEDFIRYTVTYKNKVTGAYATPNLYDVWIKGGLKIDFSVAILASGITDYTYNTISFFDSTNHAITDSFRFSRVHNGDFSFSFGGMVNILWRSATRWCAPGVSVGIAYSTNNNLQFLTGGTLQFGKSERLLLHGGLAIGQAKWLDLSQFTHPDGSGIKEGHKSYYTVAGDRTTSQTPYINKFVFKPFFGISYNLSKKNPLNAVGNGMSTYKSSF